MALGSPLFMNIISNKNSDENFKQHQNEIEKKFDIIDKKASNFEFMSYNKGAVQIEFEIDPAEIIQQNRERKGVL